MPPLAELPINILSRNDNELQRSVPRGKAQGSATTLDNDRGKVTHEEDSPSIQTMLKTTTETGHVGQFPMRSTHKPLSTLESNVEDRFGVSPSTRQYRLNGEGLPSTKENDIGHHVTQHEVMTRRFSPGIRNEPGRFYQRHLDDWDVEEDRPWPTAQSRPHLNHSLVNRHQNSNQGYQTRLIGPNGRPHSPFAYPTRLKRPGYRPSSPALSDVHHSVHSSFFSSRPASPASLHSIKQSFVPWQQHLNCSDPMLRHFASAYRHGSPHEHNVPPSTRQPTTPKTMPNIRSTGSSSRLPRAQTSMTNMWSYDESSLTSIPPPPPLFYDYSEEFEESRRTIHPKQSFTTPYKDHDQYTIANVTSQSDPVSQEARSFQHSAEKDKVQNILERAHSRAGALDSNSTRKSIAFSSRSQLEQAAPNTEVTKRFTIGSFISEYKAEQLIRERFIAHHPSPTIIMNKSSAEPAIGGHEQKSNSPSSFKSSKNGVECTNSKSEVSGNNLHSPPSSEDSVCTVESTSYLTENGDRSNSASPGSPLTRQDKSPPIESEDSKTQGSHQECLERSPPFENYSVPELTEIISPTPERSILSPNSHRRFSKILGLEDKLSEIEGMADEPDHKKDQIVDNSCENFLPIRESLGNNDTVNTSILQFSESDEENEFTPSLMQTFGQTFEQREPKGPSGHASAKISSQNDNLDNVSGHIGFSLPTSQKPHESASDSLPSKPDSDRREVHSNQAIKNRHAQIITSHSKPILRVDKELPSVPEERRSFVSIPPPQTNHHTDLPFNFAPLVHVGPENEAALETEVILSRQPQMDIHETDLKPPSLSAKNAFDRDSTVSSHSSRPWNKEASYPWANELPNLEVTLPQPPEFTLPPSRFPRFKIRIHRASTSSAGTGRLTKRRASSDGTSSSRRSSGLGPTSTPIYKLKSKPKLSISPGRVNSSRGIGDETIHTRFVESFDLSPPSNAEIISPSITLLPLSPGHEARSFFSDDSSQGRAKGSLRKRLSDFRARRSQMNVADEPRGYDRGLLGSAIGKSRASGRSSRQSQNTAGATSSVSQRKRDRSNVFRKVRFWWNRSGSKFKDWSSRVRHHRRGCHAVQVNLYPGA